MSELTKLIDRARATVEVAGDVSPVLLAKVTYELEQALEGLYRVYVNLGEDTDGARNAKELFGPWVGFDPATHIPKLVAETRKQWEEDYEADLEKAEKRFKERQRSLIKGIQTWDANGVEILDAQAKWKRGEL